MWRARFEAEAGSLVLARHYYARAVNTDGNEAITWRLWAELESSQGYQVNILSVYIYINLYIYIYRYI